jgi:hypothetical protein
MLIEVKINFGDGWIYAEFIHLDGYIHGKGADYNSYSYKRLVTALYKKVTTSTLWSCFPSETGYRVTRKGS